MGIYIFQFLAMQIMLTLLISAKVILCSRIAQYCCALLSMLQITLPAMNIFTTV